MRVSQNFLGLSVLPVFGGGNPSRVNWREKTMMSRNLRAANAPVMAGLFALSFGFLSSQAQSPQLQERVAEMKQAAASNKQQLAHYTWQERQTISIKGEVKKQKLYSVQPGPNGKPQKTEIDPQAQGSDGGRRHGLKHHVVEKKKE